MVADKNFSLLWFVVILDPLMSYRPNILMS